MKKLILLLLIVPLAGVCQTQSYKIKETTPSYQRNGERTYEVENTSNRSTYTNPGRNRQVKDRTAEIYTQGAKELSEMMDKMVKDNRERKLRELRIKSANLANKKANLANKKEDAFNEVKQLKELLDSGILTQEEFDKKATELKKIILGN